MCSSADITAHVARKFMSELSEVKLRKQLIIKTIEREITSGLLASHASIPLANPQYTGLPLSLCLSPPHRHTHCFTLSFESFFIHCLLRCSIAVILRGRRKNFRTHCSHHVRNWFESQQGEEYLVFHTSELRSSSVGLLSVLTTWRSRT